MARDFQVPITVQGSPVPVDVVHGATAGTARPTGVVVVHWIGSVIPTNAVDGDLFTNTAVVVGRILLPLAAADTPDGSGTINASARPEKLVNSGTQTTNAPKFTMTRWLFDPSTDQHILFTFIMPADYTSGGTLRLKFSSKGTTNNVIWKGAVAQSTDSSTNIESTNTVFDTVTVSAATAVPGTIGQTKEVSFALTGSYAAGRLTQIMIGRDADNASDTSTSDAVLEGATFEYTPV